MSQEELVKVITPSLPDHLKNVTGTEGLENVRPEDLILPRLVICQGLTPQRQKSKPNFIPGLNDGDLFNTVTQEIYGDRVEIIPLVYAGSRIYFRELSEGGGILCQSQNGIDGGTLSPTCDECPKSKWREDKEKGERKGPECTEFKNFPCILLPNKQLIASSFKSTAVKPAKSWLTRMKAMNKPMFAAVYEIRAVELTKPKGTFFSPVINFKRWTTAEEFQFASEQYHSIKHRAIRTDEVTNEEAKDEDAPF